MSILVKTIAAAGFGLAASMAVIPDASALPANGVYLAAQNPAAPTLERVQFYGGYGYGYPYGFYGRPFGYGYGRGFYGRGFGYGRGYGRGYYGRGGRGFYGRR